MDPKPTPLIFIIDNKMKNTATRRKMEKWKIEILEG